MSTRDQIDQMARALSDQLAAHERALVDGNPLKLEGLEESTQQFCATLRTLPTQDAREYEATLQRFIERIAVITEVLEKQQQVIQLKMESLNQRIAAQRAYNNAENLAE